MRLVTRATFALLLATALSTGKTEAAIVGSLEIPGNGSVLNSGISLISGWAFSTTPGATINSVVEVAVDGSPTEEIACCSSRGDVQNSFPNAPLRSGFAGIFNYQLLGTGQHTIAVTLTSSKGEKTTLNGTFVSSRLSDITFADNVQFSDANTDSEDCTSINNPDAPFQAAIGCHNVLATLLDGSAQLCAAPNYIALVWDRASQSFKLDGGCLVGQ
jgi:hypothetical protein